MVNVSKFIKRTNTKLFPMLIYNNYSGHFFGVSFHNCIMFCNE
jgi:hypothetical protein